jgi:hypothetical protein
MVDFSGCYLRLKGVPPADMIEMSPGAAKGLEVLKQLILRGPVVISDIHRIFDRRAYLFTFSRNSQKTIAFLSDEFLSDLPASKEFQDSTRAYIGALEKRMLNLSVADFYCLGGIPLHITIEWPFDSIPGYTASAVQVRITDLRAEDRVSFCAVRTTHQHQVFDFKKDPFARERAIINTIRIAVDHGQLSFYPRSEAPSVLPYVDFGAGRNYQGSEEQIEEFLLGKVYWLGFKRGDRRNSVWIADPWDAEYLGTTARILTQTAQVLEAEKMIALDDSAQEFATAKDGLLVRARARTSHGVNTAADGPNPRVDLNPRPLWDLFICHASEDKDDFVKPLVEALGKQNLKVWYDEFELRLGDSLLRSIDKGLRHARFGVVVLSHSFFSKPWPQKELDGLAARETENEKVILPIWHNLTKDEVLKYSPILAGKLAVSSSKGIDGVVNEILRVVRT